MFGDTPDRVRRPTFGTRSLGSIQTESKDIRATHSAAYLGAVVEVMEVVREIPNEWHTKIDGLKQLLEQMLESFAHVGLLLREVCTIGLGQCSKFGVSRFKVEV